MSKKHIPWPSTQNMKHVKKSAYRNRVLTQHYMAKVKLHGTNASLYINDEGELICQSRKRILDPKGAGDNAGFAAWCHEHKEVWKRLPKNVIVWGEWFGPGVQKGADASCNVGKKNFAVFALVAMPGSEFWAHYSSGLVELEGAKFNDSWMIVDPNEIEECFAKWGIPDFGSMGDGGIFVIPWYGGDEPPCILVDFTEPNPQVEWIQEQLEYINKEDPLIKDIFGVEGPGEGLVFFPFHQGAHSLFSVDVFSMLAFKAKTEAHGVQKTKNSISADPENLPQIKDFVESYVTENRLSQCLSELESELGRELDKPDTGAVIRWMNLDILKESEVDREANGLTDWKQISRYISCRVSAMFHARI